MEKYVVIVQAAPNEIIEAENIESTCIKSLKEWPNISNIIVILPNIEGTNKAVEILNKWNTDYYIGDSFNVCKRIIGVHEKIPRQNYTVRVLIVWKHINLEYVDKLVEKMQLGNYDMVSAPLDFDLTMAADIASLDVIKQIGEMPGSDQLAMRAKFNPWGYIELNSEKYSIHFLEPAPSYSKEQINKILNENRNYQENGFLGVDYTGTNYHFIIENYKIYGKVLDIACGSGYGSFLISKKADFVVGVDYDESYIFKARENFPETKKLNFVQGNAEDFLYNSKKEYFDMVISLDTLEHINNDKAMLKSIYYNLKIGGQFILDAPLLFKRPLGVPINPFHIREYTKDEVITLVEEAGFTIKKISGSTRKFYGDINKARDNIQIYAIKEK